MAKEPTSVKPSLTESIYERMRNLNINEGANSHLNNIRAESSSRANAQNYTPKASSATLRATNTKDDEEFLHPRPAPETPRSDQAEVKHERTPSFSSIVRRASSKGLNVLKTRRNSRSGDAKDRPPSSFIPRALARTSVHELEDTSSRQSSVNSQNSGKASKLPRSRGVSEAGSPFITHNKNTAKVVSLKRTPAASSDLREAAKIDGRQSSLPKSTNPFRRSSQLSSDGRQSSLPLSSNPFRRSSRLSSVKVFSDQPSTTKDNPADAILRTASTSTTVKHESFETAVEDTDTPHKSDKENFTPKKYQHLTDEELSPIRNFRFPVVVPNEDINHSPMSRITSVSNVTEAGTVYAEDETGKYRLKPLSISNPKQGPHLRIEASADHLLLNDDKLAEVEAKREAYMHKYSAGSLKRKAEAEKVVPELESLRLPSSGTTRSQENDGTSHSQPSSIKRKLAPPVALEIGTLKHSPTGWPLDVSKIAPFAEVEPPADNDSGKLARKAVSETNLQTAPGTPDRKPTGQDSSSSAYTIRTALNKLPQDLVCPQSAPQPKAQKSLPEFGRPLFPPRTSSIQGSSPVVQTSKGGLRKQTSGLLKSLTNQRAAFRHITHNDDHTHAHPAVATPSRNAFASSPKHMQSYNSSTRHMNAHSDIDSDQPSSPLVVPGSVNASKPKMISKVGSLLHKLSRDGDMVRHSSTRASLKHKPSVASPLTTSATTPDMVNRKDIAQYLGTPEGPLADRPTSMRSPMDLVKRDSLSQAPPAVSTPPSAAQIYHGMVKETSSKRKFPRLGHKHAATHPPTPASSEPKPKSPKSFLTSALEPLEIREATTLAFSLLDRARDTSPGTSPSPITTEEEIAAGSFSHGASQADYVELAKVIVNVVAMARETEKVAEEAKAAAAKAEIEALKTRRAVAELCFTISRMVGEGRRVSRMQVGGDDN